MAESLQARLDAMVRDKRGGAVNYGEWRDAREAVALDLLQRIEEMEATLRTLRGGIFADANAVNAFIDAALKGGQP